MTVAPQNQSPRANPYVGPQTFQRAQRDLFFGRDAEANELLSLVVARRVVLFYSESGAGKSSLINARLIPKLEEERQFEVLPIARVSGASPDIEVDNIYVYNLMNCLNHEKLEPEHFGHMALSDFLINLEAEDGHYFYRGDDAPPQDTADDARDDENTGDEDTDPEQSAVAEIWPRILIIDQFEELFT
ncbi:MAG: hypothetical protein KDD84_09450, partial [Caldilineaceae bacterium]|nr:hypothetical protein [Caldilineaceae bacterium]